MDYRHLGHSGLQVSVVGLGCNNFGGRVDRDGTRAVVDGALDAGITLFDTADVYGNRGGSETLLGEALEHAPLGAIVLDDRGTFVAANGHATALTGYSRAELLALGSAGLVADDGVGKLEAMAGGSVTAGRSGLRCKDGSVRDVAYRIGETRVAGMPFFVAVFWVD